MAENWVPLPYMKKAVKWLLEHPAAALFADPGCRKTSITYAALCVLKQEGLLKGALVLAPRRPANLVWKPEQEKWQQFNHLKVVVLHGPKKDKLAFEPADVYVATYEGFKWLVESGHLARMLKAGRLCTLVFDELSKLKNTGSQRFKLLKKWLGRFQRRWGLTGSPASNGLMNLFGQAYALDMGHTFGPYVTYFRHEFFQQIPKYKGDLYPLWVPKPGAEQLIYARMKNVALRIDGEDHLQLPQLIFIPHRFDLPEAIAKQYKQMEQDMWTSLPAGAVFTAKTAASASQKCRQITSGALYEDPIDPITGMPRGKVRKWQPLHEEKLEMLVDLLEELQGQQLLLAYEFVHEAERVAKYLKYAVPCIGGGTSDKAAKKMEEDWNSGATVLQLGHPASMGHGLNWQGSNAYHVAWFSGTWDYELYDQFIRRVKRSGNTAKHVFVHHFIARNTVDEANYAAMHRKGKGQKTLLDALKLR